MVDRILLAIALLAHTLLAAAFVLTDGPRGNRVIVTFSPEHGVHASDVPALALWVVGASALLALWARRRDVG